MDQYGDTYMDRCQVVAHRLWLPRLLATLLQLLLLVLLLSLGQLLLLLLPPPMLWCRLVLPFAVESSAAVVAPARPQLPCPWNALPFAIPPICASNNNR